MKQVFYDYDVYPKVFLGDREKTVTVQPLGRNSAFARDKTYAVHVLKVNQGNPHAYPERSGRSYLSVAPDADGCLRVTAYFEGEGEYYLNIHDGDRRICTLAVYCLAEDMAGRIPQRGDLHLHTCCSDGHDDPVNVVANYRGHGYDFMVISDHHRYYPSLEAIRSYGDISDVAIIPGEEVHLPYNDVHYVNFGGSYSINALLIGSPNDEKAGEDLAWRSMDGCAPARMTGDEYTAMIRERAAKVPLANESERMSYAVLEWIYAYAAGIAVDPAHPGFTHFVLSPRPDTRTAEQMPTGQERITYVKAHYDSIRGRIESAWDFREGKFTYSFTIPAGTTARVEFPLINGRETVVLNDRAFTAEALGGKVCAGKAVFELGAGKYVLQ